VPLSAERRAAYFARRNSELAEALAPLVVAPLEAMMAEQFAQPLGTVEASGRAGYQDLIRGTDPAPGADWVYDVGGDAILFPLSVMARLTCSAAVSDRSLTVEYRDADGVRYLVGGAPVTLAASQQQSFCWQPNAGDVAWPVNDAAIAPLPQQFLYPGASLAVHLQSGDAADQLDELRLSAYLYPTG
jgi:hypothetical protein